MPKTEPFYMVLFLGVDRNSSLASQGRVLKGLCLLICVSFLMMMKRMFF